VNTQLRSHPFGIREGSGLAIRLLPSTLSPSCIGRNGLDRKVVDEGNGQEERLAGKWEDGYYLRTQVLLLNNRHEAVRTDLLVHHI